jgi:type 2 lantibiotic biosynthesis protein LanM
VLLRLLARRADRRAQALAELLRRLEADRVPLEAAFPELAGRRLAAVSPGASDAHDGGRSVRILVFSDGVRLVYKPRSCALEAAYFALLPAVAAGISGFDEPVVRVLDRGTHGWMEHVAHRACADADELDRFHRSAGRLLALAYGLAGCDLHHENVVAVGPHLVPVDLEMLAAPQTGVPESGLGAGSRRAYIQLKDSVLDTIVLPTWVRAGERRALDVGGISGGWSEPGGPPPGTAPNLPRRDGRVPVTADHLDPLLAGFEEVYRWLFARRDDLLGEGGPLAGWASLPVRFISRPTRVYAALLEEGNRIACWRDGVERSLVFERLFRALAMVPEPQQPLFARLVQHEVSALEEEDVPCFRTTLASRDLQLPDGVPVPDVFARSGIEVLRDRLHALDDADLALQLRMIRTAVAVDRVNREPVAPARSGPAAPTPRDDLAGAEELRAGARAVLRRLTESAVIEHGAASWLAPQFIPGAQRYTLGPMPHGLYEGIGGVALFLAALHAVDATPGAAELARAALRSVRGGLRELAGRPADPRLGANPGAGLPGALYVLSHTADLLGDPELAGEAAALLPRIAAGVEMDRSLDLLAGTAGTALVLLSYHRRTGNALALEIARACGEHLLTTRVDPEEPATGWPADAGVLTGLSHGAAGFALALARLAAATTDPRFGQAARQALRFERGHFLPDEGNWRDLRPFRQEQGPMTTWCHGAPGIALGRLALPSRDAEADRELEIALRTTAAHPLEHMDHLCCGNLGRLEVLNEAGTRLNRPELLGQALAGATTLLRRAAAAGEFGCFPSPTPGVEHPGFFQGLSGIGYALLRLAAPGRLPNVLLLD